MFGIGSASNAYVFLDGIVAGPGARSRNMAASIIRESRLRQGRALDTVFPGGRHHARIRAASFFGEGTTQMSGRNKLGALGSRW